jgi:hypothetical protein
VVDVLTSSAEDRGINHWLYQTKYYNIWCIYHFSAKYAAKFGWLGMETMCPAQHVGLVHDNRHHYVIKKIITCHRHDIAEQLLT